MQRTTQPISITQSESSTNPSLPIFLSQSDDDFYGSLQRIWNNVIMLEDMGVIQQENDKFMYAYRFAELELQRAFASHASSLVNASSH